MQPEEELEEDEDDELEELLEEEDELPLEELEEDDDELEEAILPELEEELLDDDDEPDDELDEETLDLMHTTPLKVESISSPKPFVPSEILLCCPENRSPGVVVRKKILELGTFRKLK